MKRKTAVLIICYLCAAIAFTGLYAALGQRSLRGAERSARYAAEHAFEELCAAMTALDTALEKCALATTPGLQAALCSDAYAAAEAGNAAIGLLPMAGYELEKTAGFLDRAGDYARTLGRSAATGAQWSETERRQLRSFAEAAAWASGELETQRGEIAEGNCCSEDTPDALYTLEDAFPELMETEYDGVYTAAGRGSAMLTGKAETSEREACVIAAAFLGEKAQCASCAAQSAGDGHEWSVELGDYRVLVSGQGGQVLRCVRATGTGEAVLGEDSARAEAEKFLRSRGYAAMQETAHATADGCFVTEWCAVQQGVVCYPDAVRVAIALDTGELASFEAGEYVRNHRDRRFDLHSTVSWETAEELLAPGLTVEDRTYALILSPGGEERLCLSFRCRDESGQKCIVFESAATGSQERIALIREDETSVRTV